MLPVLLQKEKQEVSRQAKDAILGDALNNVIFEVCDLLPLGDLNDELEIKLCIKSSVADNLWKSRCKDAGKEWNGNYE